MSITERECNYREPRWPSRYQPAVGGVYLARTDIKPQPPERTGGTRIEPGARADAPAMPFVDHVKRIDLLRTQDRIATRRARRVPTVSPLKSAAGLRTRVDHPIGTDNPPGNYKPGSIAEAIWRVLAAADRPLLSAEIRSRMPQPDIFKDTAFSSALTRMSRAGHLLSRVMTIPGCQGIRGEYMTPGREWPDMNTYPPGTQIKADRAQPEESEQ